MQLESMEFENGWRPENKEQGNPLAGLAMKIRPFEELGNWQSSVSSEYWLREQTYVLP